MKKTALITGASSGIGLDFARVFASKSFDLVLVARDKKKLENAKKVIEKKFEVKVWAIAKDLSKQKSAEELFKQVQKQKIEVEVLVNNAGFGVYGKFLENDLGKELEMMNTNMTSLVVLSKLFGKEMEKNGKGKILNVASTAAFQPGPLMAIYYASKAFVLYFSEAIANELKDSGVTVTCICPGPTKTGFQKRSGQTESKLVKGKKLMDSKTVAEIGYNSLMLGKTVIVPRLGNYAKSLAVRFFPRDTVTQTVRNIQEKKNQKNP